MLSRTIRLLCSPGLDIHQAAAQMISRRISGSLKVAALPMYADSEELSKRCHNFLQICREQGGEGSVDLTLNKTIAEIKLNNYPKRNALSGTMMLQLEKIITELENWQEGKAVILYGEKDAFCSGGDLEFVQKIATPELGVQMSHFMQHTLNRLSNLPMVVVAMVRGVAHGGGAELTTACDYRVFTRSADIRFVQAKLGITTGWGGSSRLARLIGSRNAMFHLLSAQSFGIGNARALRFCDVVVSKDLEGLDMTRVWLEDNILPVSAEVIRAYKTSLARGEDTTLDEAYQYETEAFRKTWGSPQHVEAVANALSKKAPPPEPSPKSEEKLPHSAG